MLGGIYYTATQLNTEEIQTSDIQPSENLTLPEYLTLDFEVETYNLSSHVFFGEVTRKESRKVGNNSSYDVFTYITVQVERYDKGEGKNEVVVRYEGGTIGNMSYTAIYTPHDIVSLIVGQEAIFFTNKVEGKENLYYTYYVKKTHS